MKEYSLIWKSRSGYQYPQIAAVHDSRTEISLNLFQQTKDIETLHLITQFPRNSVFLHGKNVV